MNDVYSPSPYPEGYIPTVLIDSREKKPWTFPVSIRQKLPEGDYCLLGRESALIVDRKASISELATCLVSDRFARQCERMKTYERSLIVMEFPESLVHTWPKSSGLPPRKLKRIRTSPGYLRKRMRILTESFGVEFLFFDGVDEARDYVNDLFCSMTNSSLATS